MARVHVSLLGRMVVAEISVQVGAEQVQAMGDLLRSHYPASEVLVLAGVGTDVLTLDNGRS